MTTRISDRRPGVLYRQSKYRRSYRRVEDTRRRRETIDPTNSLWVLIRVIKSRPSDSYVMSLSFVLYVHDGEDWVVGAVRRLVSVASRGDPGLYQNIRKSLPLNPSVVVR